MLEKMEDFFDSRLVGYEEHMLREIEAAEEFYPFTAAQLPEERGTEILDLGCGTGLELEWYFQRNPSASVTGIDLAQGMLRAAAEKFSDHKLHLIQGSYFDVPLGTEKYHGAVAVESLHHFTAEEKILLYKKVHEALKSGGCFILTDYFSRSEEEEQSHFLELDRLKREQGIRDSSIYHYDTPLTAEHELAALYRAGFSKVEILKTWGATATIRAEKE